MLIIIIHREKFIIINIILYQFCSQSSFTFIIINVTAINNTIKKKSIKISVDETEKLQQKKEFNWTQILNKFF